MASLLAHAAIPLVVRKAFPLPGLERRLAIVAVVCSIWPDVDLVTLAFEVRPNEPLGHRGLTHSLLVAAVVSMFAAAVWFRALRLGSAAFWRVALFLFGVSASHGLLDAATSGDIGVALFAPITNARFALPFKLLPGCPGGLDEYLGRFGMLTFANELLYVVIPLALVVTLIDKEAPRARLAVMSVLWLGAAITLRRTYPESFAPMMPRILMPIDTKTAGQLGDIKRDDLPGGKLVTRLDELRALGLFDRSLAPRTPAWSSSFFPSWFGAESGRWMDGAPRLVWRTLFGFAAPTETEARAFTDDELFTLAPTEKVDLAFGRYDFPATKEALAFTHDARPRPRYWFGRCNGVAAAATMQPEPIRVVDVIGVDGRHVRFHPNDVKSLLAVAYSKPERYTLVGDTCDTVAFDEGATCSMNPAVFVVALLNRVGLAKESLVVDVLPTTANQYYAVASARVRASGEPRPVKDAAMGAGLVGRVVSLVDVTIDLTLSSTTLAYARANVHEKDATRYVRVGVVSVSFEYSATLALGADTELVGGRWTGEPPNGPDNVVIVSGGPALDAHGGFVVAQYIPWAFVRELARASADDASQVPTLDLRTQCDGRCGN